MDAQSSFIAFLVSVFISSVARLEEQHKDINMTGVQIIDSVPRAWQPMQIHRKFLHKDFGLKRLDIGDDYMFDVKEKHVHYCGALAETRVASWHGFDPSRDENQVSVFWMVKDDGFFSLEWLG